MTNSESKPTSQYETRFLTLLNYVLVPSNILDQTALAIDQFVTTGNSKIFYLISYMLGVENTNLDTQSDLQDATIDSNYLRDLYSEPILARTRIIEFIKENDLLEGIIEFLQIFEAESLNPMIICGIVNSFLRGSLEVLAREEEVEEQFTLAITATRIALYSIFMGNQVLQENFVNHLKALDPVRFAQIS